MFQILLWSPWKYRCGQRTVRMAVVACSQKQGSLRAQAQLKHELKLELVEEKQKLLDIRAELERRENARDSDDENKMNNAAHVPTSSEMKNAMKSFRSYLDAYSNGEMKNKMDDIEQFVDNLML
ncbi:hypothetical protein TNCV_1788571 [Trichonephila clavipes]|nr:hypothetical protein TNCV_1788571 [Trichonephila clavipes]